MTETTALTVDVLDGTGAKAGTVSLPGEVFDAPTNVPLIHQVVVAQQAAARQGTHATKNRAAVSGGGKKPYKQKGTGNARQGSIRAPQYAGGGVVHGPQPRSYEQRTPKKMKAAALRGALSDRARFGRVHVLSGFTAETPSTKAARAALEAFAADATFLVVLTREDGVFARSLNNLPNVHVLFADQLNTYDVLVADRTVFTQASLAAFVDRAVKKAVTTEEDAR